MQKKKTIDHRTQRYTIPSNNFFRFKNLHFKWKRIYNEFFIELYDF